MSDELKSVIVIFPKILKELREVKGWSQGQLGKRVGADIQRISKYERGISCPTPDMMVKFANTFEISLDYLMRGMKELDESYIKNQEWLKRLEKLNQLDEEDQSALIRIIDAVLKNHQLEKVVQGSF